MDIERAEEIRVAVYGRAMHHMGFREDWCRETLPECTLAEMLEAMAIVRGEKDKQRSEPGPREIKMTVADRQIAALYALEHYGGPEELLTALGFEGTFVESEQDQLTCEECGEDLAASAVDGMCRDCAAKAR